VIRKRLQTNTAAREVSEKATVSTSVFLLPKVSSCDGALNARTKF
jgi:hypothetical protein